MIIFGTLVKKRFCLWRNDQETVKYRGKPLFIWGFEHRRWSLVSWGALHKLELARLQILHSKPLQGVKQPKELLTMKKIFDKTRPFKTKHFLFHSLKQSGFLLYATITLIYVHAIKGQVPSPTYHNKVLECVISECDWDLHVVVNVLGP